MVKYLMFCVCVAAGYILYTSFPISQGPGIKAENSPQINRLTWHEPFTFKGATMVPRKVIDAEVRVLDKKRYFFDAYSRYSPVDIIAGWKQMSDTRNVDYIYHSMDERSYKVKFAQQPLEVSTIHKQSDLWHLIPSTSEIEEELNHLRVGHIIKIEGLLVDIEHETGFNFSTSTKTSSIQNTKGFAIWIEDFRIL